MLTLSWIVLTALRLEANIAAICKELQVPHAYASVSGTDGQLSLFYPDGPCFRCVFQNLPTGGVIQSCDQGGVMGVSPQMIGAMQAQVAIDYLLSARSVKTERAKVKTYFNTRFWNV